MRSLFAVSLVSLPIASGLLGAAAPQESWGKAGISLDQYRADALECGLQGHYTDVAGTQDAKELVRASRELDNLQSTFAPGTTGSSGTGPVSTDVAGQFGRYATTQAHIIYNARPELRYHNIKKTLEAKTAACLVQRGYSKFVLTDSQRHALRKLKFGSEQRRLYLYDLASNPSVLQSQKAPPQP
jgi:hypothetical protein